VGETVYLNGRLIQRSRAQVSALDYGYLYGFGLFETMRAYEGRVFRLDRHLRRLASSAKVLSLSIDEAEMQDAVKRTIKANNLGDARVRINVSAGEGAINADSYTCRKATMLVVAEEYIPLSKQVYRDGLRVITSTIRRDSQSYLSGMKTTGYLMNIVARQQARLVGADEALCLNEKGLLAEASMSNIFVVSNNILRTPGLESGILPGITRQAVIELASRVGVNCLEGDVQLNDLCNADESFLTSSLMEIMPLTRMGDKRIGDGRVGKITGELITEYKRLVSGELKVVRDET
jgi:branched-chain amino acid aminotransferase